jgi:hypothetical protein
MFPVEHLPAERFEKMFEQAFAPSDERRRPSRRDMLAMLSAAGAGIVLSRTRASALAQTAEKAPRFIDTHHHIYPPKFMAENVEHRIDGAAVGWTPRYSLDQMDQNGVATAFGSITNPGVWFGNNEEGRKNARECNEYGAKLVQTTPAGSECLRRFLCRTRKVPFARSSTRSTR